MPISSLPKRPNLPIRAYSCRMNSTTRRLNGTAVRAFREIQGIPLRELASRIEMNPGNMTRLEKGLRQTTIPRMARIATALSVSLDAITYPVEVAEDAA
jgi:transcriptional regulator with XRE-family HTH domain